MSEDERTVYVGNISERVSEEIIYELFLQAGPLEKVVIPKDKEGRQKKFGFVTFKHDVSVPYTLQLFDGIALYNRTLNLRARKSNQDSSPSGMSPGMSPPGMAGGRYSHHSTMGQGGNPGSGQGQFRRSNTWSGPMAQEERGGGSGRSPYHPSTPESPDAYTPYGPPGRSQGGYNNTQDQQSNRYPSQQQGWFNQGSPMPPPQGRHGEQDDARRQRVLQQQQYSIDAYRHQQPHQQQHYRNPPAWQPSSQNYRRF